MEGILLNKKVHKSQNISKKEIVFYGLGGIAGTLPYQFKQQFSMNFMTDVGNLPVGAVGFFNMLLSLWDAINDPIIGRFVDGTNTKRYGKYRPHMIFGSIFWAVTIVLLFLVPSGSTNLRLIYYTVVMALFSIFYTQFTIPWQALNSVMTKDFNQRNLLLTSRQLVGAFATSAVGLFVIPIVSNFSNVKTGWFVTATLIAFLCILSAFVASSSARKIDYFNSLPQTPQASWKELSHLILHNRVVLFTGVLLGIVNMGISFQAIISIYYLKHVVHNVEILVRISIIKIIFTFILMPFFPYLLRKFGKIKVLTLSMLVQAVASLPLLFLREQASILVVITMSTLTTLSLSCANTCCFSLIPDCTDYTEIHFGYSYAGFINSISTFIRKFFGAFSTLIIGIFLEIAEYNISEDSISVINTIVNLKVLLPCILFIGVLVIIKYFPVLDNK